MRQSRSRASLVVHENQSMYIPAGATHRMENLGRILIEIIEVQTGGHRGEDDIIRVEDDIIRVEDDFNRV
jgi:mannose-1-phosphate guanylyltransferase / mannose-6-phosphate isomerase